MTLTTAQHSTLARQVLNQADGSRPAEAAAMIATQACNGRLLDRLALFAETNVDLDRAWIDYRAAVTQATGLSGGERRLLALAGALATYGDDALTVNLDDALTGLDESNALVVARAIVHALDVQLSEV